MGEPLDCSGVDDLSLSYIGGEGSLFYEDGRASHLTPQISYHDLTPISPEISRKEIIFTYNPVYIPNNVFSAGTVRTYTSNSPSSIVITYPANDTTVFISKYEETIISFTAFPSRAGIVSWSPSQSITVSNLWDTLHATGRDSVITVTVSLMPDCGQPSSATRRITVKAKPLIEKFCQRDSNWIIKQIDTFYKLDSNNNIIQPPREIRIGEIGCALTCMAMVLKTLGYDYTPLTLNDYMKKYKLPLFSWEWKDKKTKKDTVWTGGVDWSAVNIIAKGKLDRQYQSIGDKSNFDNKKTIPLDTLTNYLSNHDFILVQVGNKHTNGSLSGHWVVLSEKKDTIYNIFDAGRCDNSRPTLTSYDNKIYRAIIYKRK